MRFVLHIYQGTTPLPGSDRWNALSDEDRKQIYADYAAINQTPGVEPGPALGTGSAARTVRVTDGETAVKEGTCLHEGVSGFLIFEASSMEFAIALAARIPAARLGGAVEIRPVEKYW